MVEGCDHRPGDPRLEAMDTMDVIGAVWEMKRLVKSRDGKESKRR